MMMVMKSYFNIIKNSQFFEKTDVLECSCNSGLTDLNIFLSCKILSVQKNLSRIRFIYSCQKVEYGCLTGTIWSNQSVKFFFLYLEVKVIYRTETSERNSKIFYI